MPCVPDVRNRHAARKPPTLDLTKLRGRRWVTRPRPHIDRIASAWLIKRFIDPDATFVFAPPADFPQDAIPFDAPGVELTHHGEDCTFETLIKRARLRDRRLARLAEVVHEADLRDGKYPHEEARGIDARDPRAARRVAGRSSGAGAGHVAVRGPVRHHLAEGLTVMLVLSRRDVLDLLTLADCIEAVERAFRLHAEGRTLGPGVLGVPAADGGFHIKAAGLVGEPSYFAAKTNANFPNNPRRFGLPTIQGTVVLADATQGDAAGRHGLRQHHGPAHRRRHRRGREVPRPARCADGDDRRLRRPGRDPARGHRGRLAAAAGLAPRHRSRAGRRRWPPGPTASLGLRARPRRTSALRCGRATSA